MSKTVTATTAPSGPVAVLRAHPRFYVSYVLGMIRSHLTFRGAKLGGRVSALGRIAFTGTGADVRIGSRVTFEDGMIKTKIRAHPGAMLRIGDDSTINFGTTIECAERIEIGKRFQCASAVILDDRAGSRNGPIIIEDHVWIAHGARVDGGVRIGRGSVVAAGSVVTDDVPPESMAIGNPARSVSLRLARPAPGTE